MLFPIQDVTISLTMPDSTIEEFVLEAPNGEDPYRFGFTKVPLQGNYRDASYRLQTGRYVYQFVADYSYLSHQMDLRRLLVAREIELRFPPNFSDIELYQNTKVYLSNPGALKNYLAGMAAGSFKGDAVPGGQVDLFFLGTLPFNHTQVFGFDWAAEQGFPGTPFSVLLEDYDTANIGTSASNEIEVGEDAVVIVNHMEYSMQDRMGTMASLPTFTLTFTLASTLGVQFSDSKVVDNGCDNTDDSFSGQTDEVFEMAREDGHNSVTIQAARGTGTTSQSCGEEVRNISCLATGFIVGDVQLNAYDTDTMTITVG